MKKVVMLLCIFMISFICIPAVYADSNLSYVSCGNATEIPAPVPQLTSMAYTLLIIATPLILIIFSIVTLIKAITAGSPDEIMKAKNKLMKKFVAAAIVFFVAGIVQFAITKAADASEKNTITSCLNCFLYNKGCRVVTK